MSVAVELGALFEKIAEFGYTPYLVTTAGAPHIVSAPAHVTDDSVVVAAGNTSRSNVAHNPVATLLWPAPAGAPYSLIVDGTATATDSEIVLIPTRAVLHRVAGADDTLASCVKIIS